MTVVADDQFIDQESEYQRGVRHLVELLSKLNPSAKEFVPSSHPGGPKPYVALSADAPSFDYYNNHVFHSSNSNRDSSSDGSSNNLQNNRRRRNGYNHGRRRIDDRHRKEEQIRRTVYVSNIDQQVTEAKLAVFFEHCGKVVDCRVCGDPHSALRFAFIEFNEEHEARSALSLHRTIIGHFPVRVLPSKTAILPVNEKFLPKSKVEREMVGRTVYCTNIDKKVTQTEIKVFFEQYCGEVSRLRLLLDNKHSTCIAFVEFALAESATLALSYSGVPLGDLRIRVSPSKTPVKPQALRAALH